jgi:hypothetical protein
VVPSVVAGFLLAVPSVSLSAAWVDVGHVPLDLMPCYRSAPPLAYVEAFAVSGANKLVVGSEGMLLFDSSALSWTVSRPSTPYCMCDSPNPPCLPQYASNPDINVLVTSATGEILATDIASNGECYISLDNGGSWATTTLGYGYDAAIAADGSYYVNEYDGVYRSTNHGATWSLTGLNNTVYPQLSNSLAAGDDGAIYASNGSASPFYCWRSVDHGATWSQTTVPYSSVPRALFAGSPGQVVQGCYGGIAWSGDGGTDWSFWPDSRGVAYFKIARNSKGVLFAAGTLGYYGAGGISWSIDGGRSWLDYSDGLPSSGAGGNFRFIAVDRSDVVWAISEASELYRSTGTVGVAPSAAAVQLAIRGIRWTWDSRPLEVECDLADSQPAVLSLVDVQGREVAKSTLADASPGAHHCSLVPGGELQSGVYFITLRQGRARVARKVALVR